MVVRSAIPAVQLTYELTNFLSCYSALLSPACHRLPLIYGVRSTDPLYKGEEERQPDLQQHLRANSFSCVIQQTDSPSQHDHLIPEYVSTVISPILHSLYDHYHDQKLTSQSLVPTAVSALASSPPSPPETTSRFLPRHVTSPMPPTSNQLQTSTATSPSSLGARTTQRTVRPLLLLSWNKVAHWTW